MGVRPLTRREAEIHLDELVDDEAELGKEICIIGPFEDHLTDVIDDCCIFVPLAADPLDRFLLVAIHGSADRDLPRPVVNVYVVGMNLRLEGRTETLRQRHPMPRGLLVLDRSVDLLLLLFAENGL